MRNEERNPDNSDINQEKNDEYAFNLKDLHRYDRKMIRGFMRGFGKIITLWLISKKRQHGYEIMTQLHESSPFSKKKMPNPSMIYPVLHDLEKKGLIKGTWEHHGKRKVKYYEITKEGDESLSRIKKLVKGHINNLYEEFLDDIFSRKRK